jgi:hypothetical protein
VNLLGISNIAGEVMKGLDSLFTSDEEREAAKMQLMQELNRPHILQAIANIREAEHPSVFVAGWRPALGWLCVLLLGYAWIGRDSLIIALNLFGRSEIVSQLPVIETGELMTLVFALLGLGATRTYEKISGVARSSWNNKEK